MSSSTSPPAGRDRRDDSYQGGPGGTWHPAREWLEEDEDEVEGDDMDFEPESDASEDRADEEEYDPDEEGNPFDSELHLGNIHIEFAMDENNQTGGGQQPGRPTRVSTAQLLNILASGGLRQVFRYHGFTPGPAGIVDDDYDDDEEAEYGILGLGRRVPRRRGPAQYPKIPSDEGMKLMRSGCFGTDSSYVEERMKRKKSLAERFMWRELGIDGQGLQKSKVRSIAQDLIPSTIADKIIHYDAKCYSGQFSDDGNFFFSCAQDFKVRMYDSSNPYEWRYYKTVDYPFGSWTITDATLSPDNRFLAYSSLRHLVCLAPTDPADSSDPTVLDLASSPDGRAGRDIFGREGFAVWSVRFSGDGREIVAGTGDRSVIVYDLETRQTVLRVRNHEDDVNAVCFGDQFSPHILYSGSDDSTVRVWDRRSMGDRREAGVFVGHTEGLTYVDSKGDGRYVLSNSKDQTMKLWDLRKMMSTAKFDTLEATSYGTGFDYRFDPFPSDFYYPHPHDCSVVTFRGHRVLRTLIRCHFSPPGSTGSRYVYSGSEDGKVYVYNLDATLAGTIDVGKATHHSRPRGRRFRDRLGGGGDNQWRTCVRDASWHPNAPVLAATSWNGWGYSTGTCTLHSWNNNTRQDEGEPPLGEGYDSELKAVPDMSEAALRERAFDDEQAWDAWDASL
ncbi:WD40-repeat-containing domain protein [Aspergillus karnatakaensis]|uniref:WD40 repeat domain-containing protein n=1 Tax=Aspergillus karnatakaensis TaxID=1810916 RepID=UPI003CCD0CDD